MRAIFSFEQEAPRGDRGGAAKDGEKNRLAPGVGMNAPAAIAAIAHIKDAPARTISRREAATNREAIAKMTRFSANRRPLPGESGARQAPNLRTQIHIASA